MWLYRGEIVTDEIANEYWGFVYIITNTLNGKKYIGKKQFKFRKSRPPLKGKKRKRISYIESDWKTYWGSNDELKLDVEKYGEDNFIREILHLCNSRSECSYLEAKEQFLRDVLIREDYYNSWISVKVKESEKLTEDMNSKKEVRKCKNCGKIYVEKNLLQRSDSICLTCIEESGIPVDNRILLIEEE